MGNGLRVTVVGDSDNSTTRSAETNHVWVKGKRLSFFDDVYGSYYFNDKLVKMCYLLL